MGRAFTVRRQPASEIRNDQCHLTPSNQSLAYFPSLRKTSLGIDVAQRIRKIHKYSAQYDASGEKFDYDPLEDDIIIDQWR